VGAGPATCVALPAALIAVPAGVLGTVGAYGFGLKEQTAGFVLLLWGLLGTFGAATLWAAVLQPHRKSILRALGLVGGILAMLFFFYAFAFDLGTLPLNLATIWIGGGPIAVAALLLGCWGWRWAMSRCSE
jgi:hypothetical protein